MSNVMCLSDMISVLNVQLHTPVLTTTFEKQFSNDNARSNNFRIVQAFDEKMTNCQNEHFVVNTTF